MSLNWEVSKIKDYETVCMEDDPEEGGRKLTVVTWSLVVATMSVGMGRITEENAAQFYARLAIIEKLHGPFMQRVEPDGNGGHKVTPRFFTPEEVWAHVGLWTNVFPMETDAKWRKRQVESAERDLRAVAERAKPKGGAA